MIKMKENSKENGWSVFKTTVSDSSMTKNNRNKLCASKRNFEHNGRKLAPNPSKRK
jgi:hypothetical protein